MPYTYVTNNGLPLTIELHWPFHLSQGGADFFVLHGRATLEDGSGRYAELAVQMSQTVHAALNGDSESVCKSAAVNAVRKACDVKDIEFTKSSKKQPIPLSSRQYSIVLQRFTFHEGNDEALQAHIRRTVYWRTKLGRGALPVGDPTEAMFYNVTPAKMLTAAQELARQGTIQLAGENATATDALTRRASEFESAMHKSLEELEAKHAFEKA